MLRKRKHIVSLRRGVYALREAYEAATPAEQHAIRVAALGLVLTAPAVLSHQSAAAEHGLPLLDPDLRTLHVTRPDGAGTREEAGVKHHAADLPDDHVVRREGRLDLTTLARTAVDVARETDRLECAVAAFDSALRMGVTRKSLTEVFLHSRSWPGARMAGVALAIADGRAANPGESWSRVVLIQQGVPPLDLQVPLVDEDGHFGYGDFGWEGVIGEMDGKGKYGLGDADAEAAAQVLWLEKRREDRIRGKGDEVVRWTYADHYRPAVIGARVRRAQARAAERRRGTG